MSDTAGRRQTLEAPNVILNPYRFAAAGTPPAINNVQVLSTSIASGTSWTAGSYTVSADANRVLIIAVGNEDSSLSSITGVTYAGETCTLLGSVASQYGSCKTWLFYLVAPPVGSGDVVINYDATSSGDFAVTVLYLSGASQAGPSDWDSDADNNDADRWTSYSVDSPADARGLIFVHSHIASIVFTAPENWTEEVNQQVISFRAAAYSRHLAAAATYTPTVLANNAYTQGICVVWGPA